MHLPLWPPSNSVPSVTRSICEIQSGQADGPSDTSVIVRPLNLFAVGSTAFDMDKAWSSIFDDFPPTPGSWVYRGRFKN